MFEKKFHRKKSSNCNEQDKKKKAIKAGMKKLME